MKKIILKRKKKTLLFTHVVYAQCTCEKNLASKKGKKKKKKRTFDIQSILSTSRARPIQGLSPYLISCSIDNIESVYFPGQNFQCISIKQRLFGRIDVQSLHISLFSIDVLDKNKKIKNNMRSIVCTPIRKLRGKHLEQLVIINKIHVNTKKVTDIFQRMNHFTFMFGQVSQANSVW